MKISKGSENSAAYDIHSAQDFKLELIGTIKTGIYCGRDLVIPKNYFGLISSRSGLAQAGIMVANNGGIIDSDYRGELKIILMNINNIDSLNKLFPYQINKGDRIAQIVFLPYLSLNENLRILGKSEEQLVRNKERKGGFGSTGK